MANRIVKFAKDWNRVQPRYGGIKVAPHEFCGDVYGLEIRFPSDEYDCEHEKFVHIVSLVAKRSGGSLQIRTNEYDIRCGIISASVSCGTERCDDYVAGALEELLTSYLPEMRIKKD